MFNADFRPVVSNEDVFFGATADVVTGTRNQGRTEFFDANHRIFQETGQVLCMDFALDDAKGNAHTTEWYAGADVIFLRILDSCGQDACQFGAV